MLLIVAIISSPKNHSWGISTSFARVYKSFVNDSNVCPPYGACFLVCKCHCFRTGFDDREDWFSDVFSR